MTKKILVLLLLASVQLLAQKNTKFPSYDEVVDRLFKQHLIIVPDDAELKIRKKPDGWHVAVDFFPGSLNRDTSFLWWSAQKKAYSKPGLPTTKKASEELLAKNKELHEATLNVRDKRSFYFSPYYGYPGWDADVIRDYAGRTNLPDSTMYALGRAYSSRANNLINNNSGYAKETFELPEGENAMNPVQLATFRSYAHGAIEAFKKVKEMNPDFQTVVGSIDTKMANEYVTTFLDLRTYQNEEEAMKELVPGLYNEVMRSFARNMLSSCPKNAILFTVGDSDTYPLLYLQAQEGFRKDVLVVNTSLLQTNRYINSLRKKILDADPLPVSFTPEQISGSKREVVLVQKDMISEKIELKDLMKFVANDQNVQEISGINYHFIPTAEMRIIKNSELISWNLNRRYLLRSELIILDVLANAGERPVCFAATNSPQGYVELGERLELEGLIYSLSPASRYSKADEQIGNANSDKLYENLMNNYDLKPLKELTVSERNMGSYYRFNFLYLASHLMYEEKKDSVKALLARFTEVLPDAVLPYDESMLQLVDVYYRVDEVSKANELASVIMKNIRLNRHTYAGSSYVAANPRWQELAKERLEYYFTNYNQPEMLKKLKAL